MFQSESSISPNSLPMQKPTISFFQNFQASSENVFENPTGTGKDGVKQRYTNDNVFEVRGKVLILSNDKHLIKDY